MRYPAPLLSPVLLWSHFVRLYPLLILPLPFSNISTEDNLIAACPIRSITPPRRGASWFVGMTPGKGYRAKTFSESGKGQSRQGQQQNDITALGLYPSGSSTEEAKPGMEETDDNTKSFSPCSLWHPALRTVFYSHAWVIIYPVPKIDR